MAITRTPPAWVAALDPSPDWARSSHAEDGGWRVEARWWGFRDEHSAPTGPREVVITSTASLPEDVRRRGVTAGVMRRMEKVLGDLVREVSEEDEARKARRLYREALVNRVRSLPEGGPRSAPDDYYSALLDLFEEVEVISDAPINDLAEAMGVPKDTVKSRLRIARKRHRVGGARPDTGSHNPEPRA